MILHGFVCRSSKTFQKIDNAHFQVESGFWIKNGRIAFPVYEITIAGNLREMYRDITAIGGDVYQKGGKITGSILVETMMIGGD